MKKKDLLLPPRTEFRLVGRGLAGIIIAAASSSSSHVGVVTAYQTASSSSSFLAVPTLQKNTVVSSSPLPSSLSYNPQTTPRRSIKSELFAGDDNDDSPFSFLNKLPDPFGLLKGAGDGGVVDTNSDDTIMDNNASSGAGAAFEPTPLGLVRQARRVLSCDYGILDASLLDDQTFAWIGPFLDQPLSKVEYLAAGRFFDLRAAFPDLDYRAHDFRIAEENDDSNTVRFTTRVTGTMRGALRLRTGVLPPTGQTMRCPPEAVSMTFDANTGKLTKLCTGFCLDRQVGNTRGATGVMAASIIAGETAGVSDWDLYPATTVISRFFGRPIRPLVEQKSVLAPFPETVMIQLCKGILATNMAYKDESLLSDKFEFSNPYVGGPIQKREFLEKYAQKEFENINNPSLSHFRVDPYDPVRVWVDVLPKSSNGYSGAPQAMSFAFDDDGFCTRITSSYVMDPSIGKGGGLGGPEGYLYFIGKPSPVFLTRPYARIVGRVRKTILSPITGVGVDDYVSTATPRLERSSILPPKPQPAPAVSSPAKPLTPIDKLASLRSLPNKFIPEQTDRTTATQTSKTPEPVKKKTLSAAPAAPKLAAPPQRSAPKKSRTITAKAASSSASASRAKQVAAPAEVEKVQRQKQLQAQKEAQQQLEDAARARRQKEAQQKQQLEEEEAARRRRQQQEQRQESLLLEETRQQKQRQVQAAEKEAQLRKRQEQEAVILAEKARAAARARMAAAAEAKLRRAEQERLEAERQLEFSQSGRSPPPPPQVNQQAQFEAAAAAARQKEAQEKARAKELAAEEKARAERQQAALDAISRAMSSASVSLFGLSGFGGGGGDADSAAVGKPKKKLPPPSSPSPAPRPTISLKSTTSTKPSVTSSPTIPLFGFGDASPDTKATPSAKKVAAAKAAAAKKKAAPSSPSISLFGFGGADSGSAPQPKTSSIAAKKKNPVVVSSSPTIPLFGFGGGGGDSSTTPAKKTPPPPPKVTTPVKKKTAPSGVPTISRWRRNADGSVTGTISGSSNFGNGEKVTTSPIAGGTVQSGEVVRTGSGSRYFLA